MNAQLTATIEPEASPLPMEIVFSFLIGDSRLRKQFEKLVTSRTASHRFASLCGSVHSWHLNIENDPDQAGELLNLLLQAPGRSVIVISDLMSGCSRDGPNPGITPWWQSLVERLPDARIGSVAVTEFAPRRVPDVDRVVLPSLDADSVFEALGRVIRTLEFKQVPRRRQYLGEVVKIRHVRTAEELRDYYELRHRVYTIMGYLDHEIEELEAGMEFDWCDVNSVPIGAFVNTPDGQQLVGTTRLITPREQYPEFSAITRRLARLDPTGTLQRRFEQPYPFQMPFLQSHPDNRIVGELQREVPDAFCEISRVIVHERFRGLGLSKRLVAYAMTVARWMGMRRIFLECLPTHRRLYEHFRFQIIPGRRQRVYTVNKTMELMEWAGPRPPSVDRARPPVRKELQLLSESGFLCLCHRDYCPGGDPRYALHGTPSCPLYKDTEEHNGSEQHLLQQWAGMRDYYED